MKPAKTIIQAIAVILLLLLAVDGRSFAGDQGYYQSGAPVEIQIVSDRRGVLTKYAAGEWRDITRRSYVAARDDERYRIRVQNRSDRRIGLVIAVDGRNIISGRKSHLSHRERMYILGPYQSGEYEGWRTGQNRVNRFYFTGMSDSYAAAWGDYSAMGVIAVAVYNDRHHRLYLPRKFDKERKPSGGPLDRPSTRDWRQEPGTGFGEAEWSPSRTVEFEPEARPAAREFIKYEWQSTLCKRGVIRCRETRDHDRRNRFWPGHDRDRGFAPFPPFRPFR